MSRHILPPDSSVPLERALSKLGIASRSQTRAWIAAGRLAVDGRVASDPARPVHPEDAVFTLDGRPLSRPATRTLLFHKPRGCITTRQDPEGRTTIFDLLDRHLDGMQAVGRLDQATSGLLLITNDTRLASALTDPASAVPRSYLVEVRGEWSPEATRLVLEGVWDEDELLQAASCTVRKRSHRESQLLLCLAEGKNREIRRLCLALGHEVIRLKRLSYGPIQLGDLPPGQWRDLTPGEVGELYACCGLEPQHGE
jgi:pseudouridine synthase